MKPLSYVVSLVQLDLQDYTTHNYSRLGQWAIHWMRHIANLQTNPTIEVAYLQLNSVKNAPYPPNYERWVKMGVVIGGQLVTLSVNKRMILNRQYECGTEVAAESVRGYDISVIDPTLYGFGYFFAPHYRNGQFVGEMYGVGGGFNSAGYFREDYQMRQFQFQNVPGSEVIMEYLADSSINLQTMIYASDVEPLRQYLHWQLVENDRKAPDSEKVRKLGLYNAAAVNHRYQKLSFTMDEYLDMCYSTTQSSPRR